MKRLISLLLAVLCLAQSAYASGAVSLDDVARVDVLAGWRTERGTHMAALRVRLAPGWKTYWRAPGDAGIPPRFDWSGSENLKAVQFHWPTPGVYYANGMRTVGYKHELVLPIELTPTRNGGVIDMRASVELGVCQDICLPVSVRIAATLPATRTPDSRITSAIASQPAPASRSGLKSVKCGVEPISDGLRLTATIDMPRLGHDEIAVFELPDQSVWIAEAVARRSGRTLTATTDLVPPSGKPFLLNRSDVRITVMAAGKAVDISGCAG